MKVAELAGATLDYWVERAKWPTDDPNKWSGYIAPYSSDWRYGGPLMQDERVELVLWAIDPAHWRALCCKPGSQHGLCFEAFGSTMLEAALRAFVGSRFGDEVLAQVKPQKASILETALCAAAYAKYREM